MDIPILYESKWTLAVNKPTGFLVESSPHYPSIEDWAKQYLQKTERQPFVGIVHRLDRAASGVLLLAKRKAALKDLHEQFRERAVQKIYLAVVEKAPQTPQGSLLHYLRKDQAQKKALLFEKPVKDAKECRLDYQLLGQNTWGFILEIHLHTGKFHQIRAQLATMGCPILGDTKYGATLPYQPEAIALHAWKLSFTEPLLKEKITLEAPPPNTFDL